LSASIDISIEAARWSKFPAIERAVRGAIEAALAGSKAADAEVSVVLTDDARIRELNRTWLGKDKPTNGERRLAYRCTRLARRGE
jgi:probable rRNA maturation factor